MSVSMIIDDIVLYDATHDSSNNLRYYYSIFITQILYVRLIVLRLSISTFRNVDDTNLEQTIHLAAESSPCRPARCTFQA